MPPAPVHLIHSIPYADLRESRHPLGQTNQLCQLWRYLFHARQVEDLQRHPFETGSVEYLRIARADEELDKARACSQEGFELSRLQEEIEKR